MLILKVFREKFMSLTRKKFREIVFYFLYSEAFGAQEEGAFIDFAMKQMKVTSKNVKMAIEQGRRILATGEELDGLIEKIAAAAYDFERISSVERTILRIGAYELLYEKLLPAKVSIAEAIRLCGKFGSAGSEKFINAVLDKIYQSSHVAEE